MPAPRQSWSMPGRADNVAALCNQLRAAIPPEVDNAVTGRIELAVAETLNNVVLHAYAGGSDAPMRVEMLAEPGRIEVVVCDEGAAAFYPDDAPSMPTFDPLDIADLPEGGFGLAIVSQCTDKVSFLRQDPTNLVVMVFTEGVP